MAREEFKAGIFTLAALGILSIFIIAISGWSPWKEAVSYRTRFPTVDRYRAGDGGEASTGSRWAR